MKLPIQAAAVLRERPAGAYYGARAQAPAGVAAQGRAGDVNCPASGNCAAWTCGEGCTCGVCQQLGNKWNGSCDC